VTTIIRAAKSEDLPAIGQLAGALVRQHYEFDPLRFMLIPNVEAGYARFFGGQLSNSETIILAAEHDGAIVGYAYARLEERDWNNLLDAHGALHDIFVSESMRRQGIARRLVEAVRERLQGKGAPRLVLHTASKNHSARQFFAALGFRETMIELTLEL
jgi:ribosomal protein S18 acetylase RimI-like enzyme